MSIQSILHKSEFTKDDIFQLLNAKDEDEQLLILYQVFKNYDLDGNNAIDKRELIPFFMDFLKGL